ncbi:MAG: helix-turn-helix transcriptional regulator [Candidatus Longimicrobiales bacterium M2_2A_002]
MSNFGMRDEGGGRLRVILVVALAFIIVGGVTDLILDEPDRWLSFHVIFELLMITGAVVLATALWLGWWRAERSAMELRRSLEERKAERDAWRQSAEQALEGLGVAINEKFDEWELTPAEREVALYLLKGHTHKGIARLTDRGHQTVRQHAAAVYRKADLAGRAELSAFFLEGLMLPEAGP